MLLKDDHEEKRRKSIKRERRKVREKGGKEAPMQMENIKMYEKTEKSEKTGKQKSLKEKNFFASNIYPLHLPNMTAGFQEKHCL